MTILALNMTMVGASVAVFLGVILLLVVVLLVAKNYLSPSGPVKITLNDDTEVEVNSGVTLLSALSEAQVFLPSACGGKGTCGQCRCQVTEGGGAILPTEKVHFSRKEQKDNFHLACQVKVKSDMSVQIPKSVLGVKEWECEVISNNNVSTFIKEFIVALPEGEHMDFEPGSYAQIRIPKFDIPYSGYDIDADYKAEWTKYGMFDLNCVNDEETVRAYSMANYPDEGDRITLNVRIATPPFKPRPQVGFMDVNPGIASSFIFNLKAGDKVMMSGPYGDFHPIYATKNEMLYVGGGAGMAPLRAHLLHLMRTLDVRDRKISYWYGARSLQEVFYLEDFLALQEQFENFTFHLALDRPDPKADEAGVDYIPGFIHQVINDNYLINHEAPEDIEYYMCGPGPMSAAVEGMLDNLGVPPENLMFDDFAG